MPLKADQRAMLQLLLERGQSYDDLASVLGVSSDEVRDRAREALRDLGGADPDAEVGLTDYLLGQADPIGRADAVRHIQSDPDTAALAEKIAAQLQLLAPDADLPELPRAKGAKGSQGAARREAPARQGRRRPRRPLGVPPGGPRRRPPSAGGRSAAPRPSPCSPPSESSSSSGSSPSPASSAAETTSRPPTTAPSSSAIRSPRFRSTRRARSGARCRSTSSASRCSAAPPSWTWRSRTTTSCRPR